MHFPKNLKKIVLIVVVSLFVYSCQKEKLNKKSSNQSTLFFSAAQFYDDASIYSYDSTGYVSKLWSVNLKSINLDSLACAVQIKSDQIILFADSLPKYNSQVPTYFGIFNKYSGKVVQNFKTFKNYRCMSIYKPIYNANDGNIYFYGFGSKSYAIWETGIFMLDLSNDEISVVDTNYSFITLDEVNNILYAINSGINNTGPNKILKLNLNTNKKEEITVTGTIGNFAFMHFDESLKILVMGCYATQGQNNLYEVNISSKNIVPIKKHLDIVGDYYSDLSKNHYSYFSENNILKYNFKYEKIDTLKLSGSGWERGYGYYYFQICR